MPDTQPLPILVTGATGTLGRLLVPRLRAQGLPVRVFTRQAGFTAPWLDAGTEVAVGSLQDEAALDAALRGAGSAFVLSPISPTLAADQIRLVRAAQRAGVRRVVKLSGSDWTIHPPGNTLAGAAHDEVEAVLAGSGLDHVILRPNAWTQVVLWRILAPFAAAGGDSLRWPYGSARVAFIDARDIADAAVLALTAEAGVFSSQPQHAGRNVQVLTGQESVGPDELAQWLGRALRRPMSLAPSAPAPQEPAGAPDGTPADFAARVHAQFARLIRSGAAADIDPTLPRILGRPARTVADFVDETLGAAR